MRHRRIATAIIALGLATAATSCITPTPVTPPPGYQPPVVDSVTLAPEVVEPGTTFQVTVAAHDDHRVNGVWVGSFRTPDGGSGWGEITCDSPTDEPSWPEASAVVVTFTCSAYPGVAVGTWSLGVAMHDETCWQCGSETRFPFEVAEAAPAP